MTEKTRVTVRFTDVTYFDDTLDEVKTTRIVGRHVVKDCRDWVNVKGRNLIFIKKANVDETFYVDSNALIKLREN